MPDTIVDGWPIQERGFAIDLLHVFLEKWRSLAVGVGVGAIVAVGIVIARPSHYTASTKLILLNQNDQFSLPDIPGLGSLLPQLGSQLLQGRSNIKDAAYAYILMSPSVRLRVVRDTFSLGNGASPMTLVEYVERKHERERGALLERGERHTGLSISGRQVSLSERQALRYLEKNVAAFSKPKPRTITLEVTTESPELSVSIARRMVFHFRNHLKGLREEKLSEEATYLQSRLEESRDQLRRAEDRLSRFESRNQGQRTARLETKQDRLERDVRMAERTYQYLLERTREIQKKIESKRSPFETLDPPTVPLEQSNAPISLVVAVFSLLGVFAGASAALGEAALGDESAK